MTSEILKLDMNGNVIDAYESVSLASRLNDIPRGSILNVANGRRSSANGFKWMYASDYYFKFGVDAYNLARNKMRTGLQESIKKILKESEDDFGWVEIPEVPKMYSYMDKVRYALLNTEFELKYDSNGSWQIWLNNPNGMEEYSGSMVSQRTPYFTPDIILADVKNTVDNHRNEWYHPFYVKLYNILKQIPD